VSDYHRDSLLAQLDRLEAIFVAIHSGHLQSYIGTMEELRRQWIDAIADDFASEFDDEKSVWRELEGEAK
jgi:hypothetical protein